MEQNSFDHFELARQGDDQAREHILGEYRDFAHRTACEWAKKHLAWGRDDELSVALLALNEAIDRYDGSRGASFRTFAATLIRSRLTDHWRREKRQGDVVHLDQSRDEHPASIDEAVDRFEAEEMARVRREETRRFQEHLDEFGMDLTALEDSSPSHRRRREKLQDVARALAGDGELLGQLVGTKRLPQKALMSKTGAGKKLLERGRRYIIALTLLMTDPYYEHLREFLQLPYLGEEMNDDEQARSRGDTS